MLSRAEKGILKAQCFGHFDISCDGEKLSFKRTKSKEMLAYLIYLNGAEVSAKEISTVILEKGTKENLNGLLREFYPKGRNLSRVSPATLKKNLALINARPKKVLNYQKPLDLFEVSIKKCCT